MPDPTDLGALDVVHASLGGLEPSCDSPSRNRVLFQPKRGNGEAVQDVSRLELEVVGAPVLNVKLVGGENVVWGVQSIVRARMLENPRPLLPDHAHRASGLWQLHLHVVPHLYSRHDDHEVEDQDEQVGNGHPALQMLLVARDVARLGARLGPEVEDQEKQHPFGPEKPEADDHADQEHESVDRPRIRGGLHNQSLDHRTISASLKTRRR